MVTGGYTKLFSSILMSSVWEEPAATRIVWLTLLALCDQYGHVDGTVRSLARVARVSVDEAQAALDTFLAPDPYDRSGVDEGRRIRVSQGGWVLVNHQAYRDRMNADDRRERDRQRKQVVRGLPQMSADVRSKTDIPQCPQTSELVRDFQHTDQIRSEADTETHTREREARAVPKSSGRQAGRLFLHRWQIDSLIDTLGPHAESFGLDDWLDAVNQSLADKALPPNPWKFIQAELHSELERRGVAVAEAPSRAPQRAMVGGARDMTWQQECFRDHGGECGSEYLHSRRLQMDAMKAEGAA